MGLRLSLCTGALPAEAVARVRYLLKRRKPPLGKTGRLLTPSYGPANFSRREIKPAVDEDKVSLQSFLQLERKWIPKVLSSSEK